MNLNLFILIIEAMVVYFIVLISHSLRDKFGLYHFYALIGGITAVMSWVTDAGIRVEAFGITFMVGSTVFYTSLLLSVFVIYVFDGPRATRIAISTIIAVSILVPIISIVLNTQMTLSDIPPLARIPMPSFRINAASVITTSIDLIFLAIAWEFFGNLKFPVSLWLRSYLTLLGVMWIDVLLFSTGAFAGQPEYIYILSGTLISRFIISLFAFPFLLAYIYWQNSKHHIESEKRPVFSILKQVAEIKLELHKAKEEIETQKQIENAIRESLDKHRVLSEKLGKENTMKELILDVITHDLKNPAGAIKGFAELLREEYPKDEMVAMVDESVVNLMSVIENATTLSMVTGGEKISKSNLNLKEVINTATIEFNRVYKDKLKLINKIEDDIFVFANPIIIEIFKNYLSNAAKYATEGDKLIITTKVTAKDVLIEFSDFGNTIPETERDKIFLRNVQLDSSKYGRGLGLAIVKRIAEAHDAEVGVRPNEPNGNIFYLKMNIINK
ncbi:MAG: ATP-binding protein [bacterium]